MRQQLPGTPEWLKHVLDASLDAVLTVDHKGRVIQFNRAAEEMFGYRAADVLGKKMADLVVPLSLRRRHQQAFARCITSGKSSLVGKRLEMIAMRADGDEFPVELIITCLPTPGPATFTGFVRDLTEQKRTEERLRMSLAQLGEAQLLARIGRGEWDSKTNVVRWSGSMFWLARQAPLGAREPEEFEGPLEVYLKQIHPDDRPKVRDIGRKALKDQEPFAFDHRVVRDDGSILTLNVRGQPVADNEGRLSKIVFVAVDVTDRIHTEEQLRKAVENLEIGVDERRALLVRLGQVHEEERRRIARELHDGLGQTLTSLSLLARDLEERATPHLVEPLTALRKQVEGAIATVRSMAWNLRPVELDQLGLMPALEQLTADVGQRRGLEVALHAEEMQTRLPPEVETAVYRIVQEGLTNTVKHAQARNVSVVISQRSGPVSVLIEDDGVGFRPDLLGAKAHRGEQLGLLSMQERATAIGGRFDIESSLGRGTTVRLRIPEASSFPAREGKTGLEALEG